MTSLDSPSTLRRVLTFCHWPLYLVWPGLLLCVHLGRLVDPGLFGKGLDETVAPLLLGLAGLVFLVRWLSERQPLLLILLALVVALLCRELHFAGTGLGTHAAFLLVAAWGIHWWWNVAGDLREGRATPYLLFAIATYALSRGVVILPPEAVGDAFRTGLEESLENLAHLAMLAVAVLGFRPSCHADAEESILGPEEAAGRQSAGISLAEQC